MPELDRTRQVQFRFKLWLTALFSVWTEQCSHLPFLFLSLYGLSQREVHTAKVCNHGNSQLLLVHLITANNRHLFIFWLSCLLVLLILYNSSGLLSSLNLYQSPWDYEGMKYCLLWINLAAALLLNTLKGADALSLNIRWAFRLAGY